MILTDACLPLKVFLMLTLKLVSILLVFVAGFSSGLLPLRMGRRASSGHLFGIGNACAGGVFLGVGLIHMLPDASSGFAAVLPQMTYPLAPLICAVGFGLFLMMEKVFLGETVAATEGVAAAANPLTAYSLAVVLSVHSLIAGVALGAERTHVQVLVLLAAIMAHKGAAAFALGVTLHRSEMPSRRAFGVIGFFACMTPLGIALGTGLEEFLSGRQATLFTSFFDALAAATFLYVAAVDILSQEFAPPERSGPKFAGFGFGLAVAALVAIWT